MAITVFICTHNRVDLLRKVLESLNAARRPAQPVEVLVIANNCSEGPADFLTDYVNDPGTRLPLRWIAILYGRLQASLAGTSGIHSGQDVLKMLMAGADVTMMASALLRHGIGRLSEIESELVQWLETHEYESVAQLKGSMSQINSADPSAFERAQYMKALTTFRL